MNRRSKIIELNDQLRTKFKGGRIQMTRDVCELDVRLRGHPLSVMSRYKNFDDESEHDIAVFIFAGYSLSGTSNIGAQTALASRPILQTPPRPFACSPCMRPSIYSRGSE